MVNAGVLDDPRTGAPVVGFVARRSAVKMRLLRQAGQASVVFRAEWEWVAVEGPVRVIDPDDLPGDLTADRLRQLLRDVFTAAGGTHDDWDEYDRVMAAEGRAAVLVEPRRITPNG